MPPPAQPSTTPPTEHANNFIRSLFRADHGKFVGDPGGHRGERVATPTARSHPLPTPFTPPTTVATPTFTPPARNLYLRADGEHFGCHLWRDHLLHHQRNYADNFIRSLFRADYGQFVGDPGSHCGEERRHQQRRRDRDLHHHATDNGRHADLLTRRQEPIPPRRR